MEHPSQRTVVHGLLVAVAIAALGGAEAALGSAPAFGLAYLPVVGAAAWFLGGLPALAAVAAVALARGLGGEVGASVLVTETVLLGVIAGAVAKIRHDRQRTERFRHFVHGLLERQAKTARLDPLTEVMNRRGFFEQLYVELARWERGGPSFGVIYLDLDNFKQVNDQYGHDRGDQLLCEVARRIDGNVKETDVPARIGGDEFVILCWNADADVVRQVAERLHRRLGEVGDGLDEVDFGISLGVACFDKPPEDVEDVVRLADAAMYEAKRSVHRGVVVWEPGDEAIAAAVPDEEADAAVGGLVGGEFDGPVEWGETGRRGPT